MERRKVEFESLEHKQTAFSVGKERVLYTLRGYSSRKPRKTSQSNDFVEAGSMLWKLGICACACALMLVMNNEQIKPFETESRNVEEAPAQTPVEEMGKLRFVELPSLISVFSQKDRQVFPITCSKYTLLEDDTAVLLVPDSAQEVTAMERCTVKAVGNDENKGDYVILRADGDKEWTLYGLRDIRVEKGQPLLASDTIGTAEKGEGVYLTLRTQGRPQNMRTFFGLEDAL